MNTSRKLFCFWVSYSTNVVLCISNNLLRLKIKIINSSKVFCFWVTFNLCTLFRWILIESKCMLDSYENCLSNCKLHLGTELLKILPSKKEHCKYNRIYVFLNRNLKTNKCLKWFLEVRLFFSNLRLNLS